MSIEVDVKLPSYFARARIYYCRVLYLYTVLYQDFRLSCHEQEIMAIPWYKKSQFMNIIKPL